MATISYVYHNNNQQCHHGQGNPKQANAYGPKTVFQSHLYWWHCFHFLCRNDDSFSITHSFSGFRFCVNNHVSAPKLLSLISVTCPMDTRKTHTGPYSELCHHLWDSLAPSVHTLLSNPVAPQQFCALPSECQALWQRQQLNVSVCHTSSAVDMLGVQVTTCQHQSCHCWKPCTVSACFHGITHTPDTFTNWQWIVTGATHHTQKSKHTSYFKVCHGSGRPSIFNLLAPNVN